MYQLFVIVELVNGYQHNSLVFILPENLLKLIVDFVRLCILTYILTLFCLRKCAWIQYEFNKTVYFKYLYIYIQLVQKKVFLTCFF